MAKSTMAQIQRAVKQSQADAARRQREAARNHAAAVRAMEQTRKAEERARAAAARASDQERKRLEKEAAAAHVEAMEAGAEERNAGLTEMYDELDSLLQATLEVDDYVDLDTLRQEAEHPPFDRSDLEEPLMPPPQIPEPPKPTMPIVEQPKGLVGRKKKLEAAEAEARAHFEELMRTYEERMQLLPESRAEVSRKHEAAEAERQQQLAVERDRYARECELRDAEVLEANAELDVLIAGLGYGTVDAIQEYVSIVLANSIYPDHFQVDHEATFDPATAELQMKATIPPPDVVPSTKAFKYVKARDEIDESALSQKDQKDRYLNAVEAVTLRTLHEVFEADRRGLIKTISLQVGTNTIDPATGRPTDVLFSAVSAERDSFMEIDLSAVVPAATLEHLGAAVSKNPWGLVSVKAGGVRRS
jgi:restriction system protein